MRRMFLQARLLPVVGLALAACTNGGEPPPPTFTIELQSTKTDVVADLRDVSDLSAVVTSTNPTPPDASVSFSVQGGAVVLAASGADAAGAPASASVEVKLNRLGQAAAMLRCTGPNGAPVTGTMRVKATLLPNGGEVTEPVETPVQRVNCNAAQDNSLVTFLSPVAGALVNNANRVPVEVEARDFDGTGANAPQTISITTNSNSLTLARTIEEPGAPNTQRLDLTPLDGRATFYVLYPGDNQTLAGPVNITFTASYKNTLENEHDATVSFQYGQAPNAAEIKFIEGTSNNTSVLITTDEDIKALMNAGSGDTVTFRVVLKDRSGAPPPDGTPVEFSCNGVGANCQALTGVPPTLVDAGAAATDGLNTAITYSRIEDADQTHPRRAVADITYKPLGNTEAGTVTIAATYKPSNSIAVSTGHPAIVELVDASVMNIVAAADPATINSANSEISTFRVTSRKGTSSLADRMVCVNIDDASSTRAVLSDQTDDVNASAVVTKTDASGVATVTVSAKNTTVRGPVRLTFVVLDAAYDAAKDNNVTTPDQRDAPCRTTDGSIQRVTGVREMQITRPSILSSLVFVSAIPTVIGVQGSSALPTSARVVFQVFNDLNEPEPNQQVTFALDSNGDPGASVTPIANSDDTGTVTAFVSSGTQAAALIVRATAARGTEYVTAASDPIAVVGGRPAWAPMHIGAVNSYQVHTGRMSEGYKDPFGPSSRPEPTAIVLQLVDRFSNRVTRSADGYQIQWRAESGSIPSATASSPDGIASAPYIPGPPFHLETSPRLGEPAEFMSYDVPHADSPQNVYRIANRRDADITILGAARGEESFTDLNGDGAFQRPYNDVNDNKRYDGQNEECTPCTSAVCNRIDNVQDPVRAIYANNLELVEPFADLPEPFLDKNEDGLRANCDLDIKMLPVHHDLLLLDEAVGTYCNPYFDDALDDGLISTNPDTGQPFTVAECRLHWCPDWDPQWNCRDDPRTPEALFEDSNDPQRITGGRVMWCPNWRYKDHGLRSLSYLPESAPYYIGLPGVRGIVVGDDALLSPDSANDRATLAYNAGTRSFVYTAWDGTAGTPVSVQNRVSVAGLQPPAYAIKLTSSASGQTRSLYLLIDPTALPATDMQVSFPVIRGDIRSPFDDLAREQLRIVQSDQFIDGNNNGQWDDINRCFDSDTLIWKNVRLLGSSHPYFSRDVDWRVSPPALFGKRSPDAQRLVITGFGRYDDDPAGTPLHSVALYDRLHSFVHVIPDGLEDGDITSTRFTERDTISWSDPSGSSDLFVLTEGNATATIAARFVDQNGVAVMPYGTATLAAVVDDGPRLDIAVVAPPLVEYRGGTQIFTITSDIYSIQQAQAVDAGSAANLYATYRVLFTLTLTYDTKTGEGLRSHDFSVPGVIYREY